MKKMFSLALALIMALALCVPTFAIGDEAVNKQDDHDIGIINIVNAKKDETYNLYRIFDLESYNNAAGAFSYKINSKWGDWAKLQTAYVTVDPQGYVTWKDGASAADFAKLALAYAKENQIAAEATKTATADGAIDFKELTLGYYLMDSSLGTLCALDSTNSYVDIYEKNSVPTVTKEVMEDSTSQFGESNTADIGQIVDFKSTITIPANAHNDGSAAINKSGIQDLVLHDKMDSVLALNTEKIVVDVDGTVLTKGTDYEFVTEGLDDGCTFEVVFKQDYLNTLTAEEHIIKVSYSAVVTADAEADEEYVNTTGITYGDDSESAWDTTTTKTFEFNLKKITSDGELLEGAEFELRRGPNATDTIVTFVEVEGGYRVATAAEIATGTTTLKVGQANILGLDDDVYYLHEIKAPDGYNQLAAPVKVTLDNKSNVFMGDREQAVEGDLIEVVNLTGAELPSTGGVGTTIFYTVGGLMMAAAVVLFVTKKKLAVQE